MRLIISNNVRDDITPIYNYIAKNSIKYANQTINNIYSCISKLEFSPYLGRYVPELANKQYRELIYKNYRIFYEVSEDEDTIYIHFIVHNKRDFKSFYNYYMKNF